MTSGGAERVMSTLANHWVAQGDDVTLITLMPSSYDFYKLDSRITRIALNLAADSPTLLKALENTAKRIIGLRRAIRKTEPDIVISFMDVMNITTLLATRGMPIPVIVAEHTNTDAFPPPGIWKKLRPLTYPWAAATVVLTERGRKMATGFAPLDKIHIIPNPALAVKEDDSDNAPAIELPSPFIVTMWRLSHEKGFDFMLEAFAKVEDRTWSLVIMGEGAERSSLETMANRLGIANRVHFTGNVKNPASILRRADIFVMSSRVEGFPNALIEAMCCKLPVISFDCPTGPAEIIRDGIDGLLVPAGQPDLLANAINDLIENPKRRHELALKAPEVAKRFSLKEITAKWQNLFKGVLDRSCNA